MRLSPIRKLLALFLTTAMLTGCEELNDDRIPPSAVRIAFATIHDWDMYGVAGALSHKRFIKQERIPSNYPYTALTYTGFGGVLLVGDINGEPQAYDLACPVERKSTIRVSIDTQKNIARCPKCGSEYDVFNNWGHPLSGQASRDGYGLRRYTVAPGIQGEYLVIQP